MGYVSALHPNGPNGKVFQAWLFGGTSSLLMDNIKCIWAGFKIIISVCINASGVILGCSSFPYWFRYYNNVINNKPDPGLVKLIQQKDNEKIAK